MDSSHLIGLTDKVAARFLGRLAGLTDEEYRWEPAPLVWNVTDDGGWDFALMPGEPPPVTTIAWRLVHIIDLLTEDRCYENLAVELPPGGQELRIPLTAAHAIAELERGFGTWRGILEATDGSRLADKPRAWGSMQGQALAGDRITFALHILDEVIHHAAEVSLLRDLYAAQAVDPAKVKALRGQLNEHDLEALKATHPALIVEAAGAGFWDAAARLIDAGFDVNAKGTATALHHAAGMGRPELVRRLLAAGADPGSVDDEFHATPLLWAQTMSKRLGGPNAKGADWALVIELLSGPLVRS